MDSKRAFKIYETLDSTYPNATTALRHKNVMELLVATILSAQCTDARVNIVTKTLFKKYRIVKDYAAANLEEFEQEVRQTGFYKNKAKNIIAAAGIIDKKFNGKVPDTMEDLILLPGVARKTANVVLFYAYGKNEGIAVDTHVKRLSGRLNFTKNTDPVKIERDLMKLFLKKKWGNLSSLLVRHGREVCNARKPLCAECPVNKLCPSGGSVGC
ncbi:MAG: endonuclease III [Candidatus Omnitrophica bacterium]|nr:endonuclease III [Candidatus Omnitrophota bacterium]